MGNNCLIFISQVQPLCNGLDFSVVSVSTVRFPFQTLEMASICVCKISFLIRYLNKEINFLLKILRTFNLINFSSKKRGSRKERRKTGNPIKLLIPFLMAFKPCSWLNQIESWTCLMYFLMVCSFSDYCLLIQFMNLLTVNVKTKQTKILEFKCIFQVCCL